MIDKRALTDITSSILPEWAETRLWVLARPMTGFVETFSHYIMEVSPGGGSPSPEPDAKAQAVLFVVDGTGKIEIDGTSHDLKPGSYVYLAPGAKWTFANPSKATVTFHWIRKRYQSPAGMDQPASFVTSDDDIQPIATPDTNEAWATTRFVDPTDLRHDMHVNIVSFDPGGSIPFAETHVMEHGIYMIEGKADYYINQDWIEVEAGDYLLLRAFSPQACIAKGKGRFRYILYKDVNRHVSLSPGGLNA
jgi:(S)-ureidoglycine aminohydrolase